MPTSSLFSACEPRFETHTHSTSINSVSVNSEQLKVSVEIKQSTLGVVLVCPPVDIARRRRRRRLRCYRLALNPSHNYFSHSPSSCSGCKQSCHPDNNNPTRQILTTMAVVTETIQQHKRTRPVQEQHPQQQVIGRNNSLYQRRIPDLRQK